eukprot:974805-Prymnesium_polylepis.1
MGEEIYYVPVATGLRIPICVHFIGKRDLKGCEPFTLSENRGHRGGTSPNSSGMCLGRRPKAFR